MGSRGTRYCDTRAAQRQGGRAAGGRAGEEPSVRPACHVVVVGLGAHVQQGLSAPESGRRAPLPTHPNATHAGSTAVRSTRAQGAATAAAATHHVIPEGLHVAAAVVAVVGQVVLRSLVLDQQFLQVLSWPLLKLAHHLLGARALLRRQQRVHRIEEPRARILQLRDRQP